MRVYLSNAVCSLEIFFFPAQSQTGSSALRQHIKHEAISCVPNRLHPLADVSAALLNAVHLLCYELIVNKILNPNSCTAIFHSPEVTKCFVFLFFLPLLLLLF